MKKRRIDIVEDEMFKISEDLEKAKILDRKIDMMVSLNRKEFNDLQGLIAEVSWGKNYNNSAYNNEDLDSLKKELTRLAEERDYLIEKQIMVKEILRENKKKNLDQSNYSFSKYNPFADKEQKNEKIMLEKQRNESYLKEDCLDIDAETEHKNNYDPFSERKDIFSENKKETKKEVIIQGQANDILKPDKKFPEQLESTNIDKDMVAIDQDFFNNEPQKNKVDVDVFITKNDVLGEKIKKSSSGRNQFISSTNVRTFKDGIE
ncbi:MAG: hypothetical protein E3K37_17280 [Candidatus Kuenenia sp.]|nr:hypothetical protein [Candidatus Kuenenia hertensis]